MIESNPSLKALAASALRWSAVAHGGKHAVQLLTTVVLVTLLDPADFGLVTMAMVFVGLAGLFHDLGTSAAVVQRRKVPDVLLCSVFWVNLLCGVLGAGILMAIAPLVALLYHAPRVEPLLTVLSLTFAVSGLSAVHGAIIRRSLAFGRLAKVEMFAVSSGAVVGITSAVLGYGAWSLVYQSLTASAFTTLGLWAVCPWRPRLAFSWTALRGITGYSLNLTGFTIFNYFARRADYLLIGRFLGATDLGYYVLAYNLMLYPVQHFSSVIGRVMFPVYSRMQDDHVRFAAAFTKITAAIATVTFPMMIGLMIASEPFVLAVFGEKWAPAAILLTILAPVGLLQSLGTSVGGIYQAKGRTGICFAWGAGAGTITVLAFVVGISYGVVGVAAAYAGAMLILIYPSFAIPFRLIDLSMRSFLSALRPALICSVSMGLVVLSVSMLLPAGLSAVSTLALLVASGLIVYLVLSWHFNSEQTREVLHFAMARAA